MERRAAALALGRLMETAYPEGAIPLDPTEAEGLRLPHISTREQLNKWEQENILEAELKFFSRKRRDLLSEGFMLRLHKQMFGNVWKWAGKYRTSEKNIGLPSWEVAVAVRGLCEDAKLWIGSASGGADAADAADKLAARFHHRLVYIHPFANGNGRHARTMADLLLVHILGRNRFTWGRIDLAQADAARGAYLEALRAADLGDCSKLFAFVRS
jgi:Fic-DOC domain mobile mystery protein B